MQLLKIKDIKNHCKIQVAFRKSVYLDPAIKFIKHEGIIIDFRRPLLNNKQRIQSLKGCLRRNLSTSTSWRNQILFKDSNCIPYGINDSIKTSITIRKKLTNVNVPVGVARLLLTFLRKSNKLKLTKGAYDFKMPQFNNKLWRETLKGVHTFSGQHKSTGDVRGIGEIGCEKGK